MSGSTTYYARVLDSSGNPIISATGQQWFALSSASLNLSNPLSTVSGAYSIELDPTGLGGLDATLLSDLASGTGASQIEVAGYNGSTLASDDIFDVALYKYEVTNAATPALGFAYDAVQQTLYTQSAAGQTVQQSQSNYDYVTRSADFSRPVTAPLNNVPAASVGLQPSQYGLSFETIALLGNEGGSQSGQGSSNSYSITAFDFGLQVALNTQSSGSGAGKVQFDDLTVTFAASDAGLPTFTPIPPTMPMVGTPPTVQFQTLDITGTAPAGSGSDEAEDFQFGLVTVHSVSTDATGAETVTFSYGSFVQHVTPAPAVPVPSVITVPSFDQPQTVTGAAPVTPFAGVSIIDTTPSGPPTTVTTFGQTVTTPGAPPTESVTVTPSSTSSGSLTDPNAATDGSTISNGAITLTGVASAVTSELDALVFTPAAGQYGTATFRITDTNSAGLSSTPGTASVAVPASPSAVFGTQANQATTDEATIKPFANVGIADPNVNGTESIIITLSNGTSNSTADGTLSGAGLTSLGNFFPGSYVLAAADAATASRELDALVFTPTAHQVTPGQQVTTVFTLTDNNSNSLISTDTVTSVVAAAVNDAPTISGTKAGQATTNFAPLHPFAGVGISDPDLGAQVSLSVTVNGLAVGSLLPGGGTLSGAGLSQTATAGVYSLAAASPAALTAELDALTFAPANAAPNSVSGTTFSLSASQTLGGSTATATDSTTTVINTVGPPLPSLITGTQAGQATTDASTINPFSAVTVTDLNGPYATDQIVIKVLNSAGTATDANGALSGAGLSKTGAGSYSLASASASAVTAALDGLVFTPSAVASGSTVTTTFGLIDANSTSASAIAVNFSTSVSVGHASGPPIVGAPAPSASTITAPAADRSLTSTGVAAVMPFVGAVITDANRGSPTETVTVTPSTTRLGTLADPHAATDGSTTASNGAITLTGSAATVTAALDALTFTPAYGQSGQVIFTVADTNSSGRAAAPATAALTVALPPAPTTLQLKQIGADLLHFLNDEISHQSTATDVSALAFDLTTLDLSQAALGQLLGQALTANKLTTAAAGTLGGDLAAHFFPAIAADLGHGGQGLPSALTNLITTTAGVSIDDFARVHLGQSASVVLAATVKDFKLG